MATQQRPHRLSMLTDFAESVKFDSDEIRSILKCSRNLRHDQAISYHSFESLLLVKILPSPNKNVIPS